MSGSGECRRIAEEVIKKPCLVAILYENGVGAEAYTKCGNSSEALTMASALLHQLREHADLNGDLITIRVLTNAIEALGINMETEDGKK